MGNDESDFSVSGWMWLGKRKRTREFFRISGNILSQRSSVSAPVCFWINLRGAEVTADQQNATFKIVKAGDKYHLKCKPEDYEKWATGISNAVLRDVNSCYTWEDALGSGAYATVYRAHLMDDPSVAHALKIIRKENISKRERAYVTRELRAMMSFDPHRYVISLHAIFEDEENIYLSMEYMNGGCLGSLIENGKRFSLPEIQVTMKCLLQGVQHLHDADALHRDIKPDNLLLHNSKNVMEGAKLADFGFCYFLKEMDDKLSDAVGTLYYMAPEIISRDEYCKKADSWSCGMTMYHLLTGQLPFKEDDDRIAVTKVLKEMHKTKERFEFASAVNKLPPEALELLEGLLEVDQDKRITVEKALRSPWLEGVEPSGQSNSGPIALKLTKVVSMAIPAESLTITPNTSRSESTKNSIVMDGPVSLGTFNVVRKGSNDMSGAGSRGPFRPILRYASDTLRDKSSNNSSKKHIFKSETQTTCHSRGSVDTDLSSSSWCETFVAAPRSRQAKTPHSAGNLLSMLPRTPLRNSTRDAPRAA